MLLISVSDYGFSCPGGMEKTQKTSEITENIINLPLHCVKAFRTVLAVFKRRFLCFRAPDRTTCYIPVACPSGSLRFAQSHSKHVPYVFVEPVRILRRVP